MKFYTEAYLDGYKPEFLSSHDVVGVDSDESYFAVINNYQEHQGPEYSPLRGYHWTPPGPLSGPLDPTPLDAPLASLYLDTEEFRPRKVTLLDPPLVHVSTKKKTYRV